MHFNEHPNLYNNIINEFRNWYGNIDENININAINKKTNNKSLKEIAQKNGIKISKGYRKVVKKFLYKDSAQKRDTLSDIYVRQDGLNILKNASDVTQKRAILKNIC